MAKVKKANSDNDIPESSVNEKVPNTPSVKGRRRGFHGKWDDYVQPLLPKIKEWASQGATDYEICAAIGIALSTFYEYKKKYPELTEALRDGRQKVVLEIRGALLKKALGFNFTEKRGIRKNNGETQSVEVFDRYCPPDPVAAGMLLRNYDKQWLDKDKTTSDMKAQELELKKAMAAATNWDFSMDDGKGGKNN